MNSNLAVLPNQAIKDNTNKSLIKFEKIELKKEDPTSLLSIPGQHSLRINPSQSVFYNFELESEPSEQDLLDFKKAVKSYSSLKIEIPKVADSSNRKHKKIKSNSILKKYKIDSKINRSKKKIIYEKRKPIDSPKRPPSSTKQKKLKNISSLQTIKKTLKIKSKSNFIKLKGGFSSKSK